MSGTRAAPDPREPGSRALAATLAALVLCAVALHFYTIAATSVDVPFLDDWDALLGFQVYWLEAKGVAAHLRLLFDPHNEHLLAVPRVLVLGVHALTGRVDFTWLNLLGNTLALLALAALWPGFRPGRPTPQRVLAFLPAVLCVAQPQAWTAVISPTVSISNFGVVAFAALCFAALARGDARGIGAAALCAACAAFSQGNGVLAAPLAALVPWLRGQRTLAWRWGAGAAASAALYFALAPSDYAAASPLASLARPNQLVAYALYFMGAAGGFARPLPSLLVGVVLVTSFSVLALRGLPRRSPVIFASSLFLFASIAANALLRAHQGAEAPLFQPRYRLYGAFLLALGHLGWEEILPPQPRRRWTGAALAAAFAFWAVSFQVGSTAAKARAAELEADLGVWWETGTQGLRHPDFRKASFFLHRALAAKILRLPGDWPERYAVTPRPAKLPGGGAAVSGALDAVVRGPGWLAVLGHAQVGGSAVGQKVEIALVGNAGAQLAPARAVAPSELPVQAPRRAGRLAHSGYHALIDTRRLPAGRYRIGVVVQQGAQRHFAWTGREVTLGDAP